MSKANVVINIRDEEGNLMPDVETAIYDKDTRDVLLKENTNEEGQVKTLVDVRRKRKVEVRCRKPIENGTRWVPFSEMHTVFPAGLELNIILSKDYFFTPA